jgi:hypothetical protein
MIRVDLTPEEATLLRDVRTASLADYRREVAGTESPALRRTPQRQCNVIEDFHRRLERTAA